METTAMEYARCVVCVSGIYTTSFILTWLLPGRKARGYAKDSNGKPLMYNLNGLLVNVLVLALAYGTTLVIPGLSADFLAVNLNKMAVVAFAFGSLMAALLYWQGEATEGHVSAHGDSSKMSGWDRFYNGLELNPRWGSFDVKMWLYSAGVSMMLLNVLSAVAYYYIRHQSVHLLLCLYAAEMCWFLFDYLIFEHVHLTTYDLVAENVGFKLAWGCLFFYPFYYPIGIVPFTHSSVQLYQLSWLQGVFSAVLFLSGWFLARGANMQKYAFKTSVLRSSTFFFMRQESIAGKLIVSGFWGYARHINYFGEILMCTGMALCGGFAQPFSYVTCLPWLYPIFMVLILLPREQDDNRRCAEKYGALWAVYVKRVPYRIIPYVY